MNDVIYSLVSFEFLHNQVWICSGCKLFQKKFHVLIEPPTDQPPTIAVIEKWRCNSSFVASGQRKRAKIKHEPKCKSNATFLFHVQDFHCSVSCFDCEHSYFHKIVTEILTYLKMLINLYQLVFFFHPLSFFCWNYYFTDVASQMKATHFFFTLKSASVKTTPTEREREKEI